MDRRAEHVETLLRYATALDTQIWRDFGEFALAQHTDAVRDLARRLGQPVVDASAEDIDIIDVAGNHLVHCGSLRGAGRWRSWPRPSSGKG